jgi:hypothetical protein
LAITYGCSHTAHTTQVYPKQEIIKNYELGKVHTTEAGDIMISTYSAKVVPGFTPRYEYYPKFQGKRLPPIRPGTQNHQLLELNELQSLGGNAFILYGREYSSFF